VQHPPTPRDYFHALGLQSIAISRKPLIPHDAQSSLLRHKLCVSDLTSFGPPETKPFHRVSGTNENLCEDEDVKACRAVFGQGHYDLYEDAPSRASKRTSFFRCEGGGQAFNPFPARRRLVI